MSSFNPNSCTGLEPAPSKEGSWRMTQTRTVVGIDVSKGTLDAAIRSAGVAGHFSNTAKGHQDLLKWLTDHAVRKAVMEATGGYEIGCRSASPSRPRTIISST